MVGGAGFEPATNWLKASCAFSLKPTILGGFIGYACHTNLERIPWFTQTLFIYSWFLYDIRPSS